MTGEEKDQVIEATLARVHEGGYASTPKCDCDLGSNWIGHGCMSKMAENQKMCETESLKAATMPVYDKVPFCPQCDHRATIRHDQMKQFERFIEAEKAEQAASAAAMVRRVDREFGFKDPKLGIGGAPTRATSLPSDPKTRKTYPVASGLLDYFPDALAAVSHVSYQGNEQHNAGQPLHWARGKSSDEADTMMRHFLERGTLDSDGIRHSAKMVWRALAFLQKEIEAEQALAGYTSSSHAIPVRDIGEDRAYTEKARQQRPSERLADRTGSVGEAQPARTFDTVRQGMHL
jgi:hypothetical protein